MVIYNLICGEGHEFEGWFGSSSDFDRQQLDHLVKCPLCDNAEIRRIPDASHVQAQADSVSKVLEQAWDESESLADFMEVLIEQTNDSGAELPTEVRKIHYRDTPARRLRGRASLEDFHELVEEGMDMLPVGLEPKLH